jgi:CHAT domain-containing protein
LVSAAALAPERRDNNAEKTLRERLASIDARLSEIDRSLSKDFPDYAALSQPEPVSIATVQAQLRPDEALVLIADTSEAAGIPEETFLWVVTKADSRWIQSDLGEKRSRDHVAALRCGLDDSAWAAKVEARCRGLIRSEFSSQDIEAGKPMPFDVARAHALYRGLFGQAEDLIKDKHLLLVPSGQLTQLPFQVLVTSLPNAEDAGLKTRIVGKLGAEFKALSPDDRTRLHAPAGQGVRILRAQPGSPAEAVGIKPDDVLLAIGTVPATGVGQAIDAIRAYAPGTLVPFKLLREGKELEVNAKLDALTIQQWVPRLLDMASAREVHWLARDHALTVLPAVSSLNALRRIAKPSGATKPVIGFGNPLLDGYQDHPQFGAYYKELAQRARALRGCEGDAKLRTASAMRGGIRPIAARGGLADLRELKGQSPLPETADELCTVARALGGDPNEIRLGARATEGEVKAMSRGGQLAQYRVIHFATHGTLAGDLNGTTEPGLILTPPSQPTEEDDGYLSASEIAGLKLDADWVILSACNTAAGNSTATGAQALSGVARAFFYAQARALLVSHWPVKSDATVKLITDAVGETARGTKVGRAEALRHAMLQLIDKGTQAETHPSYWAPFVVVGEGSY